LRERGKEVGILGRRGRRKMGEKGWGVGRELRFVRMGRE
jgi:hypothetical protein